MTNLLEQKRNMDWYDQDKVDAMGFDESDWNDTVKILDNPDVDQDTKDAALEEYIHLIFHKMGVEGY